MVRIPTHRPPTHPGEMLMEEFLKPLGISQAELADLAQLADGVGTLPREALARGG